MPAKYQGPHLWLRPTRVRRSGKSEKSVWVILDGKRQIVTGFEQRDRLKAEVALQKYTEGTPKGRAPSYVYFITTEFPGFPVKIGITTNRFSRFQTIKSMLPYELKVLGFWQVEDQTAEGALHRKFRDNRLCGEWFARTPALMALIDKLPMLAPAQSEWGKPGAKPNLTKVARPWFGESAATQEAANQPTSIEDLKDFAEFVRTAARGDGLYQHEHELIAQKFENAAEMCAGLLTALKFLADGADRGVAVARAAIDKAEAKSEGDGSRITA